MVGATDNIVVSLGIPDEQKEDAARLYDIAFGEKLAVAIPKQEDRLKILSKSMELEFAIGAFSNQKLIGLAGFSTSEGSLTGGIGYRGLLSDLGWLKGNRAALVLSAYERKARVGELLMDGIAVDPMYRGKGIGTLLFSQLMEFSSLAKYKTIRLDVIDTNVGARKLYERLGFTVEKTEQFEFLRSVLGFGSATTMIYTL